MPGITNDLNITQLGIQSFNNVNGVFTGVTITGGTGITVTNGNGQTGNPTISLTGGTGAVEHLTAGTGGQLNPDVNNNFTLAGTANQVATVGSGSTITFSLIGPYTPATFALNGILFGNGTSSIGATAAVNNGVVTTGTAGIPVVTALASNGQILIGSGSGAPIAATLTAGNGINIVNAANSITISANGSAFAYTNVNHAASPYTVLASDYYLSVDCSAGVVSLLFPNAPTALREWVIKDRTGSASTNHISVTTVGGAVTIDGQTTYTMASNFSSIQLLANATPTYEVF